MRQHHDPDSVYPHEAGADLYDDQYPGEAAGHVEAGAVFPDEPVNTVTGVDIGYDGDAQHAHDKQPVHRVNNVGSEHVNDSIGEYLDERERATGDRRPVSQVASVFRCDTIVLITANRKRIVNPNKKRASICMTNQGTTPVSVGGETATALGGPGTCSIPVGAGRTFYHTSGIWVVGAVGSIIDIAEESYP